MIAVTSLDATGGLANGDGIPRTPLALLDRDFNFIRVNEAYAQADARKVEEFPGHNHFEFYPSDAKAIFEEVVNSRQPRQVAARPFVYADHPERGVTYWDWKLTPLLDGRGEVEALVFALEDVTARKRAEIELEEQRKHLEELVRERTRALETANAWLQAEIDGRKEAESRHTYLASFPERNPNPVMEVDLDGHVQYVNPAALDLFPGLGEQGPAHPWLADWAAVVRRFRDGETDTSIRDLTVGARSYQQVFFYSSQGRFVRIYGFDITDRKQAEQALLESEHRLRMALDAAGAGMWVRDPDGGWLATPQLNGLFGRPAEAPPLNELDVPSLIHPEDLPRLIAFWGGAIESGGTYEQEYRVVWPDGSMHWLASKGGVSAVAGGPPRFLGITYDITERKRAEQALRESQMDLNRAQAVAHTGSWRLNVQRDELLWSDETYRIFGIPTGTPLTYEAFLSLVHPEDRAYVDSEWTAALRGEPYDIEHRIIVDGGTKWVRERAELEYDPHGTLLGGFGTVQDITPRKQAEDALRTKQQELTVAYDELQAHQEQLVALNEELKAQTEELNKAYQELREADRRKNEFLAVLSHELRNPLAAVQNSLQILDRAAPGGAQAKRAKAVIGRQIGQLAHLVDDLLDITRITQNKTKLQRQRLNLNELVQRTIDDHHALFDKYGVNLKAVYAPAAIYVHADGARLAQVVGNLLVNAANFTPQGGNARVAVAVDSAARRAIICIADNGIGIPPEMLPRLFQPFTQADTTIDRSRGGLGLGLALSKGLIELHGGDISVASAGIDQGSEFIVRLPLDEACTAEPQAEPARMPHYSRRVLIIEDNVDLAESLRELLELDGHAAAVAQNGPEGLKRAREFKPEVLLCDIGLPGMDGYAVARAFRADEELKGVFLVALTGYALPEDLRLAVEAGFDEHVAKPPDFAALERTLAQVPGEDKAE